ncbi:uncharacterized protein LOC117827743 isoform X3 [Notolabrus celidotus]|uniref:uncharacterized protein LOC117827743 isoform X3 n=1 Tax=Notolabrus celidotus TaxID=1203425 RepID=UPI00148F9929|nr:uncharacterized protein LOC117827743 isoform X3 [Notolabrus celidotus]
MEAERRQLTPEQDALEHIAACRDKPFLEGIYIDAFKGRGLFTHKAVEPSMFVVEYRGEIQTTTPQKTCDDSLINYIFQFSWNGAHWCIDASSEDGTLGRLVNDDHITPNCEMKKIVCEGKPHLCLFAVKKISPGEEITFSYGDLSYPWRSKKSFDGLSLPHSDFCATSSTPRVEGLQDSNPASSFDQSCSEDEYYDDDDIDELIESGASPERNSFPNTNQQDLGENSTSRDSNYSEEMSGTSMQQAGGASCSLQDSKAALSSSEPDSDDDHRPSRTRASSRASQKPKGASYATKNYCYFCCLGVIKLSRHLLRHIGEDPDLAKAFSLPTHSQERKRILGEFRTKGNYKHNQTVLKHNHGELKLKRRPTRTGAGSFVHCLYCKGMYSSKEMWRHVRRCPAKPTSISSTGGRNKVLGEIALAESPLAQKLPAAVWKMLSEMKQDRVSFAVQNDFLLLKLAEHLSDKHENKKRKFDYIRSRLREMGRLLVALQEKSITSLQDAIKPNNFYRVVEIVKKIAGYNVKRRIYKSPSLALRLGHSLKKIGAIILQIEDNNEQTKRDTRTFVKLCTEEWTQLVSHSALASLRGKKFKKPPTISFTSDLQLFYRYLESASASAVDGLKTTEGQQVYAALCRVTLAKLSVLNKCAPEVSKLTLKAFQEREEADQVLSRHFIRINIENGKGQDTAVLLTSDLVSTITLLESKRHACGVHKDNPFLFAKPNSSPTSLYHGRQTIGAFSILCRAKNPEHLRALHCHKHIARVFQILTLENDELEHLAKLLGHNIPADKDYYRLPEAAVDLAKIAKLILEMEKGSLEKRQGRSLEEVEIEDELEPDVEQLSDAEEENVDLQERSTVSHKNAVEQKAVVEKQRIKERKDRQPTPEKDAPEVEDSGGPSSSAESCNEDEHLPEGVVGGDDNEEEYEPDGGASNEEQSFDEDESDSDSSSDLKPKRRYDRNPNYCFVCEKAQTKLSRHFFTHRRDDPEIAELFTLRKNSKARFQRLDELREKGNAKHNEMVLKTGCGELKVKYKKPVKPPATKPCLFCKDIYTCKEMKKHVVRCSVRKSLQPRSCKNKILSAVASTELIDYPQTSSNVSYLLNSLKQDEITAAVMKDSHLLLMAKYFWIMNERNEGKKDRLVQKLRAMGRLLLALKKTTVSSLEDIMKPENFSRVIEAVRELAGFNEERKFCEKPSVLHTVGYSLKCIAEINYARVMKEGSDKQKIDEAQTFMRLCSNEWADLNKPKSTPTIPFIHDVQLLYECMEKTAASGFESLTKYECAPVYTALFRVTAAHLSLLNQNLDVFEITLKSFQEREEAEAADGLSQLEQILSMHLVRISVMGKWGKKIVMTLTPALLAALELLVSKREACGVNSDNLFLFAQPVIKCLFQGNRCFNTIVSRCSAEDKVNLRSTSFREHLTRVVQILSLSSDQLDQLAKLLGRDIQTDREYYQKPEAAQDIGRILELLSAVETGTLHRFEGKSFEEVEIADEMEPHMEPVNPEKRDTVGDNEESGSSFQMKGCVSSRRSSSRKKTPRRFSRKCPSKQPGQGSGEGGGGGGRGRGQQSEDEASELEDERKEDANTEQDDCSEERPASLARKTPQRTSSCGNKDTTNMSRIDSDDDMNVDFDMDTDEDIPRNEDNDGDDDSHDLAATRQLSSEEDVETQEKARRDTSKNERSSKKRIAVEDIYTDSEDHMEEEEDQEEEEQSNLMDVDSRSSSPVSDKENRRKVSNAVAGMAQVRVVIPKLYLEKSKTSIHLSELSPAVKSALKDQPVHADNNQGQKSSTSSDTSNKPSTEKEIQMICSHCKKTMMKGQTAYQKKGFTEVFCSKDCLFEMFPINKPAARPCFHCSKAITHPVDLIMAAVDVKGTMKDFCSMTCLISYKSNTAPSETQQQPVCGMCNKSGTTKCGLMLKGVFYKFCSENCFEDFRRDNLAVCEKCKSTCYKPLKLNLKGEIKTMCSQNCIDEFKKEAKGHHRCTMCRNLLLVSDMVTHNIGENMMELFCAYGCVISYKLRPANLEEIKAQLKKKTCGKQSEEESERITSGSTPAAEMRNAPTVEVADMLYCTICGKKVPKGQTVCSRSCVSVEDQHRKRCYICAEVILRPHSIILAPVDDEGTKKELCSNKCLASVSSKWSQTRCKMCNKCCTSGFRRTLDDLKYTVCSDACFTNYHKVNNLPLVTCHICRSPSLNLFTLKMEQGSKSVCSIECLVQLKESITEPQLCPMCQMFHQMADMVESKNDEGTLDFFCSSRCMMVHKAQPVTASGSKNSTTPKEEEEEVEEEEDIKEVKILPDVDLVKQEPIEEECKPDLLCSMSTEDIKNEPNVAKDLKIEDASGLYLSGDSTSTAPTVTRVNTAVPCFNCKKILVDGQTVYQKKNHTKIFCSSPCLFNFYQLKQAKMSCTYCLQPITKRTKRVLQAPVDDEGTMKDFCSQTCMSSFNYKRMMSTKVAIVPVASHSQCNMCNRYCISKHEVIQESSVRKICSDPCFLRFCNLNKLLICVNCYLNCETTLTVRMEDCSKNLCSAECLAQYKQKVKTLQPCAMCCNSLLVSEMVECQNSDGEVELFCSSNCVVASKIMAVNASGDPINCSNCGKNGLPACHFSMSDASVRSFCSQSCAIDFKATKNKTVNINVAEASEQTQRDILKPPEKLVCAYCVRMIRTTPKVIQEKGKISFVCSPSCSEEFKRLYNLFGECEQCKNERIVKITKRVNGKECFFCSDGCKMHFHQDLKKQWGNYCQSCAYCLSISKTVVKERYRRVVERFCSENCKLKYGLLFRHLSECDFCGQQGKLSQSLPLVGEVKYFCDLTCVQHFCNGKILVAPTAESSPVIANVVSLAGAKQNSVSASSTQCDSSTQTSLPPLDFQTQVVGHASVQTVSKDLKNKSTLCTPLVHNKGVSCTTQTVSTGAQTDNFETIPRVLPVPVPVYVPLPLNMYSQYTPTPVGLPIPLPVPVFLPGKPYSLDEVVNPTKKEIQPDSLKEELYLTKDRVATEEGQQQEILIPTEHSYNRTDDWDPDQRAAFNNLEQTWANTSFGSLTQPPEEPSSVLEKDATCERQRELTNQSLPSALETREHHQNSQVPVPAPSSHTAEKVHNKNKGRKLQHFSKEAEEETPHRDFSKAVHRRYSRVESQCGIIAWNRWIQQRRSQAKLLSFPASALKEEILLCSAAELNNSLCGFIKGLKQLDGEPYSPDNLFYLCLCIQQYLFENGRVENIFSDSVYNKFSSAFTKILRGFKPSITASGYTHSYVEEEFLWECKQLGAYSPIVLLNTMLFFCCKYLGFTTVEQHRQLSFAYAVRRIKTNPNNTKTRFLLFCLPKSTKEAESDEDGVPSQKRKKNDSITTMTENTENPLRCPVRLYEFYLSKCSESVRHHPDLFYLQPNRSCVPSSPVWFSCSPLDDSMMEAMLVRNLAVRVEDREGSDEQTPGDKTTLPQEKEEEDDSD